MAGLRRVPVPFATQSGKQRGEGNSVERLVNWMVEAEEENAKYPVTLLPTPGAVDLYKVDDTPVTQFEKVGDKVYFTTGKGLYLQYEDIGWPIEPAEIGPNVSMATNGNELVIVDGLNGWAWDGTYFSELQGDGWYPAATVDYIDGRFIFTRKDTGQFFLSDLKSVELSAENYAEAEGAPDNTEAVVVDHREVWLFGTDTTEIWLNTGESDFTLERHDGAFIERGIAGPRTAAKLDNSVFWLGDDRIVYRAAGYAPVRVSSHAVEKDLNGINVDDAHAYTYTEDGHTFYVLNLPSIDKTWALDLSNGRWHERSSTHEGISFDTDGDTKYPRHLANCCITVDGRTLVGDYRHGTVYEMSVKHEAEAGVRPLRIGVGPYLHDNRRSTSPPMIELDLRYQGTKKNKGEGAPDIVMIDWTDDGVKWSAPRIRKLPTKGIINKLYKIFQIGLFKQRAFRLRTNGHVSVLGMYVGG